MTCRECSFGPTIIGRCANCDRKGFVRLHEQDKTLWCEECFDAWFNEEVRLNG